MLILEFQINQEKANALKGWIILKMFWRQSWSLYAHIYLIEIDCFMNRGPRCILKWQEKTIQHYPSWEKIQDLSLGQNSENSGKFKHESRKIQFVCLMFCQEGLWNQACSCLERSLRINPKHTFTNDKCCFRINIILWVVHPYSFAITARKAWKTKITILLRAVKSLYINYEKVQIGSLNKHHTSRKMQAKWGQFLM